MDVDDVIDSITDDLAALVCPGCEKPFGRSAAEAAVARTTETVWQKMSEAVEKGIGVQPHPHYHLQCAECGGEMHYDLFRDMFRTGGEEKQ
jgi:hypothetical protein